MVPAVEKRLFTADEYREMARAGILQPDDHVELIEGEIIQMSPIGNLHAAGVRRFLRLLQPQLRDRVHLSVQSPIRLSSRSEPQPDLALLRPRADDYARTHPGPQDVLLVIEVADTSVSYDREVKIPLYADAGIPEAWLMDAGGKRLAVHRDAAPGGYRSVTTFGPGQSVSPAAFPDIIVHLDDLFRDLP